MYFAIYLKKGINRDNINLAQYYLPIFKKDERPWHNGEGFKTVFQDTIVSMVFF